MPTQKFWVKGLSHDDEDRIATGLREVDGVFFAVLNHTDQCAEVEFSDGRVTVEEIREAIERMGYDTEIAG